jgi:preprotein translocase subunit Sss1
MFKPPKEEYRSHNGKLGSNENSGVTGVFFIPLKKNRYLGMVKDSVYGYAKCTSDNRNGWEIVSVCIVNHAKDTHVNRKPTIEELQLVRENYWESGDRVITMITNPPKEENKDTVKYAILFKKIGSIYELPL